MEKSGKLYEAIQFYRRAVQLVPDIEFRLHDASKAKQKDPQDEDQNVNNDTQEDVYAKNNNQDDSDDEIKEDILTHIQKKMVKTSSFCVPQFEQNVMKKSLSLLTTCTLHFQKFPDHSYISPSD